MGGSESKSVVNQLSETITNIAMNSVLDCQVAAVQDQNLLVENTGWNLFGSYKLEQTSDIKSSCFTDSKRQTQLQNEIINAVKNATTASGGSIMPAFGDTSSNSETNLTNIVRTSITSSNLQKNYNSIRQAQNVTFKNSGVVGFQQLQLTQGAQIFAASTLKALDDAGIFNAITTHIDQKSSADTSLFNFDLGLGGLFGGGSSWLYLLVIIVVVFIAYRFFSGRNVSVSAK
jgi:hypothetical protein